jgi:hypothetical protein
MKGYRTLLVVTAAVVSLVAAHPSVADSGDEGSISSLTGEEFLTSELPANPGSLEVDGTCNPLGTSTFTFTAAGFAFGPYPGEFVETGTVTMDALGLATFEASFTIDSAAGTVTGQKVRETPAPLGLCGAAAFPTAPSAGAMRFEGTVDYTATIVTPSGTATDSGTSFVNMGDAQVRGVEDFNGFVFSQTFTSTGLVLDCDDDEVGDDQGDQGDQDCDEDG